VAASARPLIFDLKSIREFDWVMFLCAAALVATGITFIWSASFAEGGQGILEVSRSRLQLRSLAVALVLFFLVIKTNYRTIAKYAYHIYAFSIFLLVVVLVHGVVVKGSGRWIALGGTRFQPSEFAKVAFVLVLARYLTYRKNYRRLRGLVVPFMLALVPMGLIVLEPDIGTAMLFPPVLLIMLFTAGARLKHLVPIVILGFVLLAGVFFADRLGYPVLKDYQKARIFGFLELKNDPYGASYQLIQSMIAIGSGGLVGKGLGNGTQNRLQFLPERHTDFIFSVIGEEWGFIGAVLVPVLFFLIILGGVTIANRTREPCGRLIAVGGVSMIGIQAFLNMGMTVRLCPISGMTLPYVSYGGSSLVSSFLILGLVISVGMRRPFTLAPEDFE